MKYLSIKIKRQDYLRDILRLNPLISSGRKNYKKQYERILRNILLVKKYKLNRKSNKNNIFKRKKYKKEGDLYKIYL